MASISLAASVWADCSPLRGGVSITSVTVATTLDGSSVSDCDYW